MEGPSGTSLRNDAAFAYAIARMGARKSGEEKYAIAQMWRQSYGRIMGSIDQRTDPERIPTMYINALTSDLYRVAELRRNEDCQVATERRRHKLLAERPGSQGQLRNRLGAMLIAVGARMMTNSACGHAASDGGIG